VDAIQICLFEVDGSFEQCFFEFTIIKRIPFPFLLITPEKLLTLSGGFANMQENVIPELRYSLLVAVINCP